MTIEKIRLRGLFLWLHIISRVRTAIEEHDGYIHIPKLEPIEA